MLKPTITVRHLGGDNYLISVMFPNGLEVVAADDADGVVRILAQWLRVEE